MSKNIIICGCPLAGKSTFANMISQSFGYSHIPTDAFITAFLKTYPQLNISHEGVSSLGTWKDIASEFYPFLRSFIDELDDQNITQKYVLEGFHIDIGRVMEDFGKTHTIIVFGYPNITTDEKFEIVRKYDTNNWTNSLSDESIYKHIKLFIDISQYCKEICLEKDIRFIDVSYERKTILETLVEEFLGENRLLK